MSSGKNNENAPTGTEPARANPSDEHSAILGAIMDCILILDADGRITGVNSVFLELVDRQEDGASEAQAHSGQRRRQLVERAPDRQEDAPGLLPQRG